MIRESTLLTLLLLPRAQTQHFGKGLRAAPRARWNDGLLDFGYLLRASRAEMMRCGSAWMLCASRNETHVAPPPPPRRASIFLQLPVGSHETNPVVPYLQAQRVVMEPTEPGASGEGGGEARVYAVPSPRARARALWGLRVRLSAGAAAIAAWGQGSLTWTARSTRTSGVWSWSACTRRCGSIAPRTAREGATTVSRPRHRMLAPTRRQRVVCVLADCGSNQIGAAAS